MLATGVATAKGLRKEWEGRPVLFDAMTSTRRMIAREAREDRPVTIAAHRVDASGLYAGLPMDGNAWSQLTSRAPEGFPSRLRGNVNLWLGHVSGDAVLRTRHLTPAAPRSAFAVVSPKYTACDLDRVATLAERLLPADAHAQVNYDQDSTRWLIDASLAPTFAVDGEIGVGRVHRAGIRLSGADNGTSSIRAEFYAERIRCINCTIITTTGLQFARAHKGTGIEEAISAAVSRIGEAVEAFGSVWREANVQAIHDAYDGTPVGAEEAFRRLVAHEYVRLPGMDKVEAVEALMDAWNYEPGDTAAAINRALTRAAHTTDGVDAFAGAELEAAAGELLFNRVYTLPRLSKAQAEAFAA